MQFDMLSNGWYKPLVLRHIDLYGPCLEAVFSRYGHVDFRMGNDDEEIFRFDSPRDLYICPICLNRVVYRHADYLHVLSEYKLQFDFDLDHYPPEAIGGRQKILVCKTCNNKFGTSIDAAAKKFLEVRFFLAGINNSSMALKIKVPWHEKPFKAPTYWKDGVLTTIVKRNFRPPEINPGPGPLTVHFGGDYPHDRLFRRAIMRSAYLKCFAHWGYDFVTAVIAKRMVAVLNGEMEHPSDCYGVYFASSGSPTDGIYQFEMGGEIYFAVYFKVGIEEIPYYEPAFVIIPSNTENAWNGMVNYKRENRAIKLSVPIEQVMETVKDGHYFRYRQDTRNN